MIQKTKNKTRKNHINRQMKWIKYLVKLCQQNFQNFDFNFVYFFGALYLKIESPSLKGRITDSRSGWQLVHLLKLWRDCASAIILFSFPYSAGGGDDSWNSIVCEFYWVILCYVMICCDVLCYSVIWHVV